MQYHSILSMLHRELIICFLGFQSRSQKSALSMIICVNEKKMLILKENQYDHSSEDCEMQYEEAILKSF